MKSKISKVLGVVLSLALLSSLTMIAVPVSASGAGDPTVMNEWETLTLPSGVDCDVEIIEQAEDGTIFVSIYDEVGMDWDMYKSADGYAWVPTCIMNQPTRITAIEASDNYTADETVYVAVNTSASFVTTIYRCTGGAASGVTPGLLGQISAGEHGTTAATLVYDIDSHYDGSDVWLLAATDIDVFAIPDDNGLTTVWTDMELSETLGGTYADGPDGTPPLLPCVDVYKAMFAPDFSSSGVIWAVYYDVFTSGYIDAMLGGGTSGSAGYGIIARSSGSTLWGTIITPVIVDDGAAGVAKVECDVEFASDYSSLVANNSANLYAALNFWGPSTGDDVYSIECDFYGNPASVTPFSVDPTDNIDFVSLEVEDNLLVVGSYDLSGIVPNCEVWVSLNYGITWNMATKNPTGELGYPCNLLISNGVGDSPDDAILAGTGGVQSALSISEDDGDTWNQIAFIDNDIDSVDDIAFDPTSTAAALITQDTGDGTWSLWKTANVNAAAPQWQRTLCTTYSTTITQFDLVEYSMDGTVAMLYDDNADRIYRSSDDLQTFVNWKSTAAWGTINRWVVYDSSSVYAACTNGFWSTAVVGSDLTGVNLVSIAVQTGFNPGDANNAVLIVGDNAGNAYISYDAGDDLEAPVAVDPPDTWPVYVAFDADNNIYFASGDDVLSGAIGATNIVMGTVQSIVNNIGNVQASEPFGGSSEWLVDIDISPDNTLYVLSEDCDVARYLINDVNYGGVQSGWDIAWNIGGDASELWVTTGTNTLWTIDTSGTDTVNLLDDTLTGQVTGLVFSDILPFSFVVDWAAMTGATDYEVNIYVEGSTSPIINDYVSGTTYDVAAIWGPFALFDATDYMVEVRVNNDGNPTSSTSASIGNEVEISRWSAAAAVMTDYYMTTPIPTNPAQGADEVSLTPSFGWSAVEYAVTYKFELSDDPAFDSLIDSVSVTTTAYSYVGDGLDYDSDYYWRVQAVAPNGTTSEWSTYTEVYWVIWTFFGDMLVDWESGAISNFHTEEEEFPPVTVEPPPTPTLTVDIPDLTASIPPITLPDITVVPPDVTVNLPTPTVTSIEPVTIEEVSAETPAYIWAIVAIGAVLTIAVIVLIVRTRRVV